MKRALAWAALGTAGYLAYRMLKPRFDFRGKHVVITGGSRGLGLVMARQLVAAGARVSICSRDSQELARAVAELRERGRVVAVECDITERDRVREFLAVARQQQGQVDVLINNAGMIRVGPFETMTDDDFELSLRTHFWASLYATREVLPEMKSRGEGRIVNIASFGGKVAVPHLLPYTVGKFALVGFSNGLRDEVSRHGIVVTTVCPGLMRTGSHLNAEFKGRHEEEYAWFALSGGLPVLSLNAECAAARILLACSQGDAEVVIGLPFKAAVAVANVFPNLTAKILSMANRMLLPEEGGIGTAAVRGRVSRGQLPDQATRLSDHAAADNNEIHAQPVSSGV
jgi:NAD(P)-dependent dehydrogenase (short-subunit alcohol dehydrogenase family)